jgi:hypothetical protein
MKRSLAPGGAAQRRHRAGRVPRRDSATRCHRFPSASSLARRFVEFRAVRPCSIGMEVCFVPAGMRPGHRESVELPCSCHLVAILVRGAQPRWEGCSSVSRLRAAGVRKGLRDGLHGGVRGGLRPGLEPPVRGQVAGRGAVGGAAASADSLGVVCGFGVDRLAGGHYVPAWHRMESVIVRHEVHDRQTFIATASSPFHRDHDVV